MAEHPETIDAPSDEPLTVSTPDSRGETQSPSPSSPHSDATLPEAEGDDMTDQDDFLNWDPWGDDTECYPEGFWNHMNLLDVAQTPHSNERPPVLQTESADSESTTRAGSPKLATALNGHAEGDNTTDIKEETAKNTVDEEKEAETKKRGEDEEIPTESVKECTICLESMATDRYPDTPHAAESEHSSDVCHACWEQHLESEVNSKVFEGVSCPQCSQRLLEADVRKLANSSTYAQ
jgi:DNA-directed RNA polymerase subunit RPC12/RpoP